LWKITLPLLQPTTFFIFVTSLIGAFQVFDQVYVMTGGGPYRSTELAAITVWREGFARLHLGSAAALAVALFLVLLFMTVAYGRLARDEVAAR
jgi:multiple sugar transport system permease protein